MYTTFELSKTNELADIKFEEGERLFSPIFVSQFLDQVSLKITRKELFKYLTQDSLPTSDIIINKIFFNGRPALNEQELYTARKNISKFVLALIIKVRNYYQTSGLVFTSITNTLEAYLLLNCQVISKQRSKL